MPAPAKECRIVLLADDDPIFRSLAAARLARMDCHVVEAQDGIDAWRRAKENEFNLAVVDFEMPGLNGIELIQCLRGHPRTVHMPIVMCTSRTDSNAMREAIEAGVTSFLTKPVNWSLFDNHLDHLLNLGVAAAKNYIADEAACDQQAQECAEMRKLVLGLRRIMSGGISDDIRLVAIRSLVDGLDRGHSGEVGHSK
ncbi:MAG: response regulator [Hyphomicrobiaceae bacterium]|nr:response regulator [Hyphomicrobiaceae bacterium]